MKMATAAQKTTMLFVAATLSLGLSWLHSEGRHVPVPREKPIVILAEKVQGRVTYKVDSKPVRTEVMLDALRKAIEQRGGGQTVLVLVDVNAPVSTFGWVRGVAGKLGLAKFRYFMFQTHREYMSEVTFGPTIPFSTNPPLD